MNHAKMIHTPSPNFGPRPASAIIDMLVLHYTGMRSATEALARLCDPVAEVSAHYLIDEDGTIHAMVAEEMRAWHAGKSEWRGDRDVNSRSIGIELVNPGHEFGYRAFPQAQIAALIQLTGNLVCRHPIPPRNIVGHSDVAPTRKQDPGELFPWEHLASQGLGLWPLGSIASAPIESAELLARYGYDVTDLPAAITAFQRHFRPSLVDGNMDGDTAGRLMNVLDFVTRN